MMLSFALIASLYFSIFTFTYADAVRVPNISTQERAQTDKLVTQLKTLLVKYPTKASAVAAKLQTLENRTSNAKNKRIYAKLREVADSYTQTSQLATSTNVSVALQWENCTIPSNYHPRKPGGQETASYLPISTLLSSVKQYDISRDWSLSSDKTKRIVGDEPLYFRADEEKILLLNSLDYCKLAIGKIGDGYWLIPNARLEDSSLLASVSMSDAGKYMKAPGLTIEDLKAKAKEYAEITRPQGLLFEDDKWQGYTSDMKYFFNFTKSTLVTDGLFQNLQADLNYLPNLGNSLIAKTNGNYYILEPGDYIYDDTSTVRTKVNDLVTGKTSDDEKIRAIYDWMTSNISYDDVAVLPTTGTKEAMLGINPTSVFATKKGICSGYSQLFLLMLNFAGISDIHFESWEVYWGGLINGYGWWAGAGWHAWVRIGNSYYDPTWWQNYYKLPKNVMYARNKENFEGISSGDARKNAYIAKLTELAKKYKWQWYKLLEPFENK